MISPCFLYCLSSALATVKETVKTLRPEFKYAGFDSISSMRMPSARTVETKSGRSDLFLSSRWTSKWFERSFRCVSSAGRPDMLHSSAKNSTSASV